MAKVQIGNVIVLDNPSSFLNPFQFELTFECIEELKEGSVIFFFLYCNYLWNIILKWLALHLISLN